MAMDIELLRHFFFWCMIINSGVYLFTAIAVLVFRSLVFQIQTRLFGIDDMTVGASIQKYLGNYKLFITFFNFTPWIALHILS